VYPQGRRDVIKVATAGVIGTTIEWYDFNIAATASTLVWPSIFFPSSNPASGIILSLLTLSAGFISRPVGAILFGHFGDKVGRKTTLIWTLLTMGLGTLGTGLVLPYDVIGIWSGVLLAIFRTLQGIGVGGEYGGAVTWVLEFSSRSKYRAFWTGWVQQGSPIALVLVNLSFYLLTSSLTRLDFLSWGWRIPFYIGAAIIVLGIVVRYKLMESPIFKEILERRAIERIPISGLLRNQWKTVILLAISWWYLIMFYYVITAFSINYIKLVNPSLPTYVGPLSIVIGRVLAIIGVFFGSIMGDKIGRRKTMFSSSIISAVLCYPYIILLSSGSTTLIILAQSLILFITYIGYGSVGAFFSEQFPTKHRFTGTGFSYHLAAPFSGGLAPIIASLFVYNYGSLGSTPYIALLTIIYCITSAIAIYLLKETVKIEISH